MLSEPASLQSALSSASISDSSKSPTFADDAQALLARSGDYVAVALTEGEMITRWCSDEHNTSSGLVSAAQVSALLPTLNLLIQTIPSSGESSDRALARVTPARVSFMYTHEGKALMMHAQTHDRGALVLITSASVSGERAHFWLGSRYNLLLRHAQHPQLDSPD